MRGLGGWGWSSLFLPRGSRANVLSGGTPTGRGHPRRTVLGVRDHAKGSARVPVLRGLERTPERPPRPRVSDAPGGPPRACHTQGPSGLSPQGGHGAEGAGTRGRTLAIPCTKEGLRQNSGRDGGMRPPWALGRRGRRGTEHGRPQGSGGGQMPDKSRSWGPESYC